MEIFLDIKDNSNKAEVLRKNLVLAEDLRRKIKLLDSNPETVDDVVTSLEEIIPKVSSPVIEEEDEDYKYYYENIKDAIAECKNKKEMEYAIYDNLPNINNGDYVNIVRRIILEFVKDKNILEQLKVGETEKEILELSSEQERLDFIIGIIRNHRNYEKTVDVDKIEQRNNLVFLKTPSGNIYAESDLASIDFKYYPAFKGLLESIENGTFKRVKRFASNDTILNGISEVKDFKIRVVFDRLDKDTYVIIDIIVKKSDCDAGYEDQLRNRVSYYKSVKKRIKEEISDEYLEENQSIYANLKDGLDRKVITKTKRG